MGCWAATRSAPLAHMAPGTIPGAERLRRIELKGQEHGRDYCGAGQGAARDLRRRHDGLQEGAGGEQRRPASSGRLAAQEGPGGGRQEGRPRGRRGPGRRVSPRARTARWSRSIPRPISSPATSSSRASSAASPSSPLAPADIEALKTQAIAGRWPHRRRKADAIGRHHRREHAAAPHGDASA